MTELKQQQCEECRVDAPRVRAEQVENLKPQIPNWELIKEEEIDRLRRVFTFEDFEQALTFTNRVGALAEQEGHHPAILTEWGSVTVTWWTHKIGGLHVNDFISAAKTDELI